MTQQVFYRKWRPQRFADVVGQEYVTQTLLNALASGRLAHAYLFCGPRGTGKTSMGRILAKAVNCPRNGSGEPCNECPMCLAVTEGRALDLIEIDAASNRGIDEMRSLREKVNFAPNESRYKVYIIDEVHMLTNEAFNAVLKTLEEPPPHAIFVLATTEPHRLPATVTSRCQRFDFRRISLSDAAERLARICQHEEVEAGPEVLNAIARSAGGSLRDAENMLEQLVVGYGQHLEFEQLREFLGLGGGQQVREVAAAALNGNLSTGLAAISQAANDGLDLRQLHRQLMEYLRGLLLAKAGAAGTVDLPQEGRQELQELAATAPIERILQAVKLFAQVDLRDAGHSTLPLELALVEAASAPSEAPVSSEPPPPRAAAPAPPPQPVRETPPVGAPLGAPPPAEAAVERPAAVVEQAQEPAAALDPAAEVPSASSGQAPSTGSFGSAQDRSGQASSAGSEQTPSPDSGQDPSSASGESGQGLPELVGRLKANWRSVIEASRGKGQKYRLDALLRSACEPVSVDAEAVVLGFSHQFHVDRMREEIEHPGTRLALEEALGVVLGSRRQVRCIVMPKEQKPGGHLVRAAEEMGAKVVEDGG